MTSFAFILGVFPLVVTTGAGSEMRQSLGTAVFFGMLGVAAFGLLFTPAFYTFIRSIQTTGKWLSAAGCPAPPSRPARSARTTPLQKRSGRRSITWSIDRTIRPRWLGPTQTNRLSPRT
jgi:AcrB/AcrD/AcrF family